MIEWALIIIIPLTFYLTLKIFEQQIDLDGEKVFPAELVSINDADTVKLNFHGRIESYRILFIDAPEIGQPYAEEATAMLVGLLQQGLIEFSIPTSSSYGRNVCKIYVNGSDVGLQLLKRGCAWIDTRYEIEPNYIRAFADAVEHKKGLFERKNPVHPSLYRSRGANKAK